VLVATTYFEVPTVIAMSLASIEVMQLLNEMLADSQKFGQHARIDKKHDDKG